MTKVGVSPRLLWTEESSLDYVLPPESVHINLDPLLGQFLLLLLQVFPEKSKNGKPIQCIYSD
jgi:hypothetical protein